MLLCYVLSRRMSSAQVENDFVNGEYSRSKGRSVKSVKRACPDAKHYRNKTEIPWSTLALNMFGAFYKTDSAFSRITISEFKMENI